MRERHSCVGGDAERSGHAWNDFEGDSGLDERLDLFAAATEEEGVATFEAYDRLPALRALDQHRADLSLGVFVRRFLLADVQAFGMGRSEREERVGCEVVE